MLNNEIVEFNKMLEELTNDISKSEVEIKLNTQFKEYKEKQFKLLQTYEIIYKEIIEPNTKVIKF
jgi:hypothetical protein